MDLLAALQAADYTKAQPLIEKVLKYEPANELMLEYRVVVQRALEPVGQGRAFGQRDARAHLDELAVGADPVAQQAGRDLRVEDVPRRAARMEGTH